LTTSSFENVGAFYYYYYLKKKEEEKEKGKSFAMRGLYSRLGIRGNSTCLHKPIMRCEAVKGKPPPLLLSNFI
jgi:hypothetical protein